MTINNMTPLEHKIEQVLKESLEHIGYVIVRVKMSDASKRPNLQIMLDRCDLEPITIEDCEQASNLISALLDVEDIITHQYDLEVSSAGLDRPLMRIADFTRYVGCEAKIQLKELVNNRKRIKANILGVEGSMITLSPIGGGDIFTVNFDQIFEAKLMISDDLFNK